MNKVSPDDQTKRDATPYDLLGGEAGVRKLVDRFYDIMAADSGAATIRAMHAADLSPMRQKLFEFLSGWLGGPRLYSSCVMSAHRPYAIGSAERDQWLMCMRRALEDTGVNADVKKMLERPLFAIADALCNR
jgi:hemoglobin